MATTVPHSPFSRLTATACLLACVLIAALANPIRTDVAHALSAPQPAGITPKAPVTVPEPAEATSLRICATLPTLASLAREIGGEYVEVTALASPSGDPYRVHADATFRECMAEADIYLRNGVGLEQGWSFERTGPPRSREVVPGGSGYLDASHVAQIRETPASGQRSVAGTRHANGNPHYLLDPLNALAVAKLLEARFASLLPAAAEEFAVRGTDFEQRLGIAMVGPALAPDYHAKSLALLFERGDLADLLQGQGRSDELAGWFYALLPWAGTKVVVDTRVWSYFTHRFNIRTQGILEPVVGQGSPLNHLRDMAASASDRGIGVLIATAYTSPAAIAEYTQYANAHVAVLEHQTGSSTDTTDYISMITANVDRLVAALEASTTSAAKAPTGDGGEGEIRLPATRPAKVAVHKAADPMLTTPPSEDRK
ncbi:MAG: ABC-type Zn uptake system ZnuABC Zn-binding protein ZnuA [Hyphomicrobiaceae bacterium]|jgi:ABC-type Zn uptake system ZnuABC Zn-binding protein ZnuA